MSLSLYQYSNKYSQFQIDAYVRNKQAICFMDGETLVIQTQPVVATPRNKTMVICHRYFTMALVSVAHENFGYVRPNPEKVIQDLESINGFSMLNGQIQSTVEKNGISETRISGQYLKTLKDVTDLPKC